MPRTTNPFLFSRPLNKKSTLRPCSLELYGWRYYLILIGTVSGEYCIQEAKESDLTYLLPFSGFQAPLSEADVLRRRLQEEIEKAELANKARLEADARCHLAEKERDIYRLLALRAQRDPESNLSLRQRIEEDMDTDALEEAATAILLGGGSLQALGFQDLFRRFRNQDVEFTGSDIEEEDEASYSDRMEEDDEDLEESTSEASLLARRIAARHENYSRALVGARQIRAVSIAGEDI
jgi:hypothetical protein